MSRSEDATSPGRWGTSRARSGSGVRTAVTGALGLVVGFVAGVSLFESGPGIEPLTIVSAVACAVTVAVAERRVRRGQGR